MINEFRIYRDLEAGNLWLWRQALYTHTIRVRDQYEILITTLVHLQC